MAGGFYITVHGANFGTVDSHPSIKIGGDACSVTAWKSNNEVNTPNPDPYPLNCNPQTAPFKAQRLVYQSTLGSRVTKKKKKMALLTCISVRGQN